MEMKVFVIGDRDTVLGFSLVGVEGMATENAEVATQKLGELLRDPDLGIVLVTAAVAQEMRATLEELEAKATTPLILEVPDRLGRRERVRLRDLVRRALGVSV